MPINFDFTFSIGAVIFLFSLAQAIFWVSPTYIRDNLNNEPATDNSGRRLVIAYGALSVITFMLLRNKNIISSIYGLNAKRYIRSRKKNDGEKQKIVTTEGLYYRPPNNKDKKQRKIVYFFDDKKYSKVLTQATSIAQLNTFKSRLVQLKPADFTVQSGYRFNKIHYSWHTERYTLSLLKAGEKQRAVQFIYEQITSGNLEILSDYRILDLAAKMFVRLDTTKKYLKLYLDYLNQKIDTPEYSGGILQNRFYKWGSEKWVNKIKEKNVVVYNNIKF